MRTARGNRRKRSALSYCTASWHFGKLWMWEHQKKPQKNNGARNQGEERGKGLEAVIWPFQLITFKNTYTIQNKNIYTKEPQEGKLLFPKGKLLWEKFPWVVMKSQISISTQLSGLQNFCHCNDSVLTCLWVTRLQGVWGHKMITEFSRHTRLQTCGT